MDVGAVVRLRWAQMRRDQGIPTARVHTRKEGITESPQRVSEVINGM